VNQTVEAGPVTGGAVEILPSRRVQANRENARNSTGPRTPAGRARIRLNALRHGILAREILAAEDGKGKREFQGLIDRFCADLAPVGPLEELLVERIVTCAWRLARVLRAEAGAVNVRCHHIVVKIDEFVLDGDEDDSAPAVERASSSFDIDTLLGELAGIRERIEAQHLLTADELDYFERLFGSRPDVLGSSKSRPRSGAAVTEREAEAGAHLDAIEDDLRASRGRMVARERLEFKHRRAAVAIPDAAMVATITRYESAIDRALNRSLHELERLQARRRGEAVLPRLHVDVDGLVGRD
jgi:hypothetical protein